MTTSTKNFLSILHNGPVGKAYGRKLLESFDKTYLTVYGIRVYRGRMRMHKDRAIERSRVIRCNEEMTYFIQGLAKASYSLGVRPAVVLGTLVAHYYIETPLFKDLQSCTNYIEDLEIISPSTLGVRLSVQSRNLSEVMGFTELSYLEFLGRRNKLWSTLEEIMIDKSLPTYMNYYALIKKCVAREANWYPGFVDEYLSNIDGPMSYIYSLESNKRFLDSLTRFVISNPQTRDLSRKFINSHFQPDKYTQRLYKEIESRWT